jgi:hypothetical protein
MGSLTTEAHIRDNLSPLSRPPGPALLPEGLLHMAARQPDVGCSRIKTKGNQIDSHDSRDSHDMS